jgi:TRAP-type C4-dicarboxylate transport system substrate-binding protein
MWDGFWLLGNRAAWDRLPPKIQEIVSRNLNASALKQRKDVADLNAMLQKTLEEKGMVFNTADPAPFREKLRKNGFYAAWKRDFGDEEWDLLEKVTGKLV